MVGLRHCRFVLGITNFVKQIQTEEIYIIDMILRQDGSHDDDDDDDYDDDDGY